MSHVNLFQPFFFLTLARFARKCDSVANETGGGARWRGVGCVVRGAWVAASNDGLGYVGPAMLVVSAGVGGMSGFGVTVLRIPLFIMTLAMGIIIYSLCLGYTQGTPRGYPAPALSGLMRAHLLGVPAPVWLLLVFVVIAVVFQSWTVFGRWLYAVGNNPVAAHVSGLSTRWLTIGAYAISAMCAGFTGIALAAYANGATLRMGDDYLLPSIAAVVVGGSSILGGKGNFLGTVGGAILLTTLGTILAALGIEQGWKTIIEGAVILIALIILRESVYEAIRVWMGRSSAG